jgi:molybdopterin molybdotransferase
MKSIQEALELMLPAFVPLGVERLPLSAALGRFLADDVRAREDSPPFDNSAMDGYAVRAEALARATEGAVLSLPLRGESRAGGPEPQALAEGTTMRVFTGARLPPGADAVVMQEAVRAEGGQVHFSRAPAPGEQVRLRASDVAAGAVLLPRGGRLAAGELGILAAQGLASVTVHRRPRVALLGTGDELRDLHDPPRPGSIVNSNAYALAAQVREAGGEPVVLPNVGDELEATLEALRGALDCDLVLTCGGVSVGAYDLVKQAFAKLGVEADFWKVNIKPGKPLTFGRRGRTPLVGLPGNPVSAMVAFEALVRPGLRRLLGDPRPFRVRYLATLAVEHRHERGRLELARAKVTMRGGTLVATPLRLQGSGSLPSMVDVDALLVLDEAREVFAAGEVLPALLVRDGTGSEVSPFAAIG